MAFTCQLFFQLCLWVIIRGKSRNDLPIYVYRLPSILLSFWCHFPPGYISRFPCSRREMGYYRLEERQGMAGVQGHHQRGANRPFRALFICDIAVSICINWIWRTQGAKSPGAVSPPCFERTDSDLPRLGASIKPTNFCFSLTGRSLPYEVSGGIRGGCEKPGDSEPKLFSGRATNSPSQTGHSGSPHSLYFAKRNVSILNQAFSRNFFDYHKISYR